MRLKRALPMAVAGLLAVSAAEAPSPVPLLPPAEAAAQGRALVDQLLSQAPAKEITHTGVIRTLSRSGQRTEVPVSFQLVTTDTNWSSIYQTATSSPSATGQKLVVTHAGTLPNQYQIIQDGSARTLAGNETMIPFAGTDFWVADLGLEFLHWPEQRLVKKEMRRGQSCNVLESVNSQPASGSYGRVLSWMDIDTGGIIYAEAFDSRNRLLKEFMPKSIKKVRGEWQLQEMKMENRQTGSRTWIEFNLDREESNL